jgi:nitrate reductase NapE component
MAMSTYPVVYEQEPSEKRNRLTVFFRAICVIPHVVVAFFYGIAFFLTVLVAWFAIIITGRWPAGLYEFAAGFMRFSARLYGYLYLITDVYPPFDTGEHPEYPVRLIIAPPKESYSRLKAFFRVILSIPIYIVQYVFSLWLFVVAIALWIVAVITGRTPTGLTEAMRMPMAFYLRANAYFYLITEDWPPFDPGPGVAQHEPPSPIAA